MEGTASETWRLAVLTSGHSRGSNLRALHNYFRSQDKRIRIVFVTVSLPSAPVVDVCGELGLQVHHIPTRNMGSFEERVLELCRDEKIDLIVLAGFLKRLSSAFIEDVGIPILNIHPALLPKYGGKGMYGERVHKAVFAAGERESGPTVHLVNAMYDQGSILAQRKVDISGCGSPQEIAAEVLRAEHSLYGPTISAFLEKRTK